MGWGWRSHADGPCRTGPLQPQPCPRPHLEDLAIRGTQEGDGVAVFSCHRHGGQVQASALQHGIGCESLAAAQWVGQVLRATQEALTGALWTVASTVGIDTRDLPQRPLCTKVPGTLWPHARPQEQGPHRQEPARWQERVNEVAPTCVQRLTLTQLNTLPTCALSRALTRRRGLGHTSQQQPLTDPRLWGEAC